MPESDDDPFTRDWSADTPMFDENIEELQARIEFLEAVREQIEPVIDEVRCSDVEKDISAAMNGHRVSFTFHFDREEFVDDGE